MIEEVEETEEDLILLEMDKMVMQHFVFISPLPSIPHCPLVWRRPLYALTLTAGMSNILNVSVRILFKIEIFKFEVSLGLL